MESSFNLTGAFKESCNLPVGVRVKSANHNQITKSNYRQTVFSFTNEPPRPHFRMQYGPLVLALQYTIGPCPAIPCPFRQTGEV